METDIVVGIDNIVEPDNIWIYRDEGDYVELIAEQRSKKWFDERLCRATASLYEKALNLSPYGSDEDAATEILGLKPPTVTNEAMMLGIVNEDPIRQYILDKNPGMKIREPSLCLSMRYINVKELSKYTNPASDPLHPHHFIGASPDGIIYNVDGSRMNMEIKFTKKLYEKLLSDERGSSRWNSSVTESNKLDKILGKSGIVDKFDHINRSHYFQMVGTAFCTNVNSCLYCVGAFEGKTSENVIYEEIIPFDYKFYSLYLYPNLIHFIKTKIIPKMTDTQLHEFSQRVQNMQKIIPNNRYTVLQPF